MVNKDQQVHPDPVETLVKMVPLVQQVPQDPQAQMVNVDQRVLQDLVGSM